MRRTLAGRETGMRPWLLTLVLLTAAVAVLPQSSSDPPMVLRDRFGRDLRQRGVTLVDWEGHIANPAVQLTLELHERVNLPARVVLRANGCRLMFDLFSEVGPDGPTKTLLYPRDKRASSFLIAIFPDRDGADEEYTLEAELTTGMGERRTHSWPIHVRDQDRPGTGGYPILLDYRHDRTGFFDDPKVRRILETAVHDWAYFFDDQRFAPVLAGTETAFIHDPATFARGWRVVNEQDYTGFLLFAQGIRGPDRRSGGRASDTGGLQVRDVKPTGLRRSGTVISEVTGNWNGLGWSLEEGDDRWWVSSCHAREPHDYYSIVRHEVGHCLLYHKVHPAFARLIRDGRIRHPLIEQYLGMAPRINESEHLYDTVDPVSRVGAFGNEYGGDMPRKRWLITKVDLLMLQAVGYRLRSTTPLQPLAVPQRYSLQARIGQSCQTTLPVSGGVPDYCFRTVIGTLPDGITLNEFTGALTGVPQKSGSYKAVIEIADQDPTLRPRRLRLQITVSPAGPEHALLR